MKFPNTLASARAAIDFTQIEAAQVADIHNRYWQKVERGDHLPSFERAYRIAETVNRRPLEIWPDVWDQVVATRDRREVLLEEKGD